jgi:hypothetical protein
MARTTPAITRDTPPEQLPLFLSVAHVAALLGLSEQSVRDAVRKGDIPKVPLPTDNILIARGTVLRLACLSESAGAAQELARLQAAVDVAREKVGRIAGELRNAEEALRLAEARYQEFTRG